jgi:hypothetical protein
MAKTTTVSTMIELQKMMPRLLSEHGDDTKLMLAAMANPILALEYIGVRLSKDLKTQVERRVRFNKASIAKLVILDRNTAEIIGPKIDSTSSAAITNFLKKEIGDEIQLGKKKVKTSKLISDVQKDLPFSGSTAFKSRKTRLGKESTYREDTLDEFKNVHKLIPILLEKRKIDAGFPKLANAQVFEKILKESKVPDSGIQFSKVRFSLQERSKRKNI